jgi:DNA-binding HxlR family transcriptional regulator
MYKYGQYCPIARAVEILGDRWTLLIVRDLLTGTHHFNELRRGLPGISRALLADRLRRLEDVGVLEKRRRAKGRRTTEYHLTQAGEELQAVIQTLLTWGARWSFGEPDLEELDPLLLLWWIRGRVHVDHLPKERVVVEFDFYGADDGYYWLVLTPGDVSVCLQHPGYDVDVVVTADLAAFFQVWLGKLTYAEALRARRIDVEALPALARDFPNWFAWSLAAPAVRAAMTSTSKPTSISSKDHGGHHETSNRVDPAAELLPV